MTVLSKFAGKGRAVLVAVTLGAAALTSAAPAAAQGFGIHVGPGGGGVYVNPGFSGGGGSYSYHDYDNCWSDYKVIAYLRSQGYRNIDIYDHDDYDVDLYARKNHYKYDITFDACRGKIISRDRIGSY